MSETFVCGRCNVEKPLSAFKPNTRVMRGFDSVCKLCVNTRKNEQKFENFVCDRCGIVHMMWVDTFQKRVSRGMPFARACRDCVEVFRSAESSAKIWERFVADQKAGLL